MPQHGTIGSARNHGVIGIGHGRDAGEKGNLLAPKAMGVPPPIPALVMMKSGVCQFQGLMVLLQDGPAQPRMVFEDQVLRLREYAFLVHQEGGDGQFPDIVKRSRHFQEAPFLLWKAKARTNETREMTHSLAVQEYLEIPLLQGLDQETRVGGKNGNR